MATGPVTMDALTALKTELQFGITAGAGATQKIQDELSQFQNQILKEIQVSR